MRIYFFGCWGGTGHYLRRPGGVDVWEERHLLPWAKIDGALCPGWRGDYHTPEKDQFEGHAALHHAGGWTALAWWDRSVDQRGGSNAVLFADGTWTAEEMLRLGHEHFPRVMSRFRYEIRVVERVGTE